MLVLVAFALRGAGVAGARAEFEHLAEHLLVRSRSPQPQVRGRVADIGAVEADADALPHVLSLGETRIRAAAAHLRAIHGVMDRIAERLVDVAGHRWVKCDHLADGHWRLLARPNLWIDGLFRLSERFPRCKVLILFRESYGSWMPG